VIFYSLLLFLKELERIFLFVFFVQFIIKTYMLLFKKKQVIQKKEFILFY